MKPIYFSFGYFGPSKWGRFTYNLCNLLPFIPTIECELFKTYYKSNKPFRVRHSIYLGFLKYYVRISKTNGKWKTENLTDVKM